MAGSTEINRPPGGLPPTRASAPPHTPGDLTPADSLALSVLLRAALQPAPPWAVQPSQRWVRRLGLLLLIAAALCFLLLAGRQLYRPLMYDDVNFALAARAVADTGQPYGNQGWMSDRGDFSHQDQWALWHPPLYIYLVGLSAKLLGPTPAALRLPGLIGGAASGLLTYLLGYRLAGGSSSRRDLVGGVAAALAMLSPLFVQSALVVDIDFALLLPLTLLFLWLYLRFESGPRWPWLIPLFGVLLWTKMTNPLPLLAAVCAWQVLRGQVRRAITHALAIGFGGAALFGATWVGIGTLLGWPLAMPFQVNALQWQDSAGVARRAYAGVGPFVEGLQPTIAWLGPGLVALGLAAAAVRGARLAQGKGVREVDLVLGLAVLLVLGYVNKSAGWFPKYQVALAPLLAVAGAPLVAWGGWRACVLAVAAGCASAFAVANGVGDWWALQRAWTIPSEPATWLLAIVVVCAGAGLVWRRAAPTVVLAGLAVGWGLATTNVMASAPYSTTYWYGTTGTAAAAAWIDATLPANALYVASKDVAFAAKNQRYVDQDTLVTFLDADRPFGNTWQGQPIAAIVAWTRDPFIADLLSRRLPPLGFVPAERIGDYQIYLPRR